MYKPTRRKANLSIEEAAYRLHIAPRTLCKYEAGESTPSPEVALAMGKVYKAPELTSIYCRKECAIGQAYCYDLLNNVDLSAMAIITKYRQEGKEADEAVERLATLMLNKKGRPDCSDAELQDIWNWALELLDLEHVIETLKLRLWDFLDVADLVTEHNRKCIEKRYVDTKKPDLQLAG